MEVKTTRFGDIQVDDDKIIVFKNGILGFEDLKEYVLISSDDGLAFHWLQSISNPAIALACIDPLNVCENYSPIIEESVMQELDIKDSDNILILCVVVIPADIMKTTVNLAAPIIINTANRRGKQIVLQNDAYSLRHLVFKQNGVL